MLTVEQGEAGGRSGEGVWRAQGFPRRLSLHLKFDESILLNSVKEMS